MATVKVCPYDCPDFNRFNTCQHEQKVKQRSRRYEKGTESPGMMRRNSLPGIFSVFSGSPPLKKADTAPVKSAPADVHHLAPVFDSKDWTVARAGDELLDVHFELMLRELAVPEKTLLELIQKQSGEQKKRLLRLHAMHQSPKESGSDDWVERFCTLRDGNLEATNVDDLCVSLRTANRSALDLFVKRGGLDKLADRALKVSLLQVRRTMGEVFLLNATIRALDRLARLQSGMNAVITCSDAMCMLALASFPVPIIDDPTESDEKLVQTSLESATQALLLLVKLGFASERGEASVLVSMRKASAMMRQMGPSTTFLLVRMVHQGGLASEPRTLADKCFFADVQLRLAALRFLVGLVEMSPGERAALVNDLHAFQAVDAAKKLVQDVAKMGSLRQEVETQAELFVALLQNERPSTSDAQRNVPDDSGATCVIPASVVLLKGVIGSGSFGTVYLGMFRGAKVAVKCLHRRDTAAANVIMREAQVLGKCQNHPNIVRFFGTCFEKDEVRLVFEFCELGSLEDVVVRCPERVELEPVARYARQAAAGLAHLHELGVIHRDVAARNVLVDARGVCKVSDFGMARIRSAAHQQSGSGRHSAKTASSSNPLKWAAPESLRERTFSRYSDAWMFGVFVWELWYQSVPFPSLDHFAAGCKVAFESLTPTIDDERGIQGQELMELCKICWLAHPEARPSMDLLVEKLDQLIERCEVATFFGDAQPTQKLDDPVQAQLVQDDQDDVYDTW